MFRFSIFIVISMFFMVVSSVHGQIADSMGINGASSLSQEETIDHASSVYEFFLSNMMALESGDFLVKIVRLKDSTDRPGRGDLVAEETQICRVRFDHLNKRYMCLVQQEYELLLLVHDSIDPALAEKAGKRFFQHGFVHKSNQTFVRRIPEPVSRLKRKLSVEQLFEDFRVPDVRTIGVLTESSKTKYASLEKIIPRLASGQGITNAYHAKSGNLVFERRVPVSQSSGEQYFVTNVQFDKDSLMPVIRDISVDVLNREGKRVLTPHIKERVEWEELSSIFVPSSVQKEAKGTELVLGERFYYDVKVDIEFKWFNLNERMAESDFDSKHLDDFGSLLNFKEEVKTESK